MNEILIVAEHRQSALRPVTLELVTVAASLATESETRVCLLLIAPEPEPLASALALAGLDEILFVRSAESAFAPDCYAHILAEVVRARAPGLVLLPHSVDGCSYAPAVALACDLGFASDVFALRVDAGELVATRAAYREKVHVECDFPARRTVLLTVRPGAFRAAEAGARVPLTELEPIAAATRTRHLGFVEPEASGDVDISAAPFILAIGRGAGDASIVEEMQALADRMGAALACSRPIADAGWLPKTRQVGQSGRTATACRLYLAMGISGAVQHLAGMKHVEHIIAVNRDPEAPIFSVARHGVVADVADIVDELKSHFD